MPFRSASGGIMPMCASGRVFTVYLYFNSKCLSQIEASFMNVCVTPFLSTACNSVDTKILH